MKIEKYRLIRKDDTELDEIYDDFEDAKMAARDLATEDEPIAIIALIFDYSDSELVWDSLSGAGCTVWPPGQEDLL